MFFLYILKNPKNHLYVGVTSDLKSRIERHISGDGAEFTKRNKKNGMKRMREDELHPQGNLRKKTQGDWSHKV